MKRRSKAGGKAVKAASRKAATPKRFIPPNAVPFRRSAATTRETETERLTRERDEALEQQKATAEVLRIISASPGDVKPVFNAILTNATRLCEAKFGILFGVDDGIIHAVAALGVPPALAAFMQGERRPGPHSATARAMRTGDVIHISDFRKERGYREGDPMMVAGVDHGGIRTLLAVPMLKDKVAIGVIGVFRQEVRPFTDKQIELVENFAAQAVIAIENTRLLNELRRRTSDLTESLEQQKATSEVLSVISSSPGELERVFQAMLENATRICEAKFGSLALSEGDAFRLVAMHNAPHAYVELRRREPFLRPFTNSVLARAVATKRAAQTADVTENPATKADPQRRTFVALTGARTLMVVPMLKENEIVGAIIIYRQEVRPFTDKQIELVQNFAAQAVIAIENTRLLNELRQSLEQQTATADVLRVISSSPGELQPVFQAMLENATRICEAKFGTLFRCDGNLLHLAAQFGTPPKFAEYQRRRGPFLPGTGSLNDRVFKTRQIAHSADYMAEPNHGNAAKLGGARSTVAVPMLKDDQLVGTIVIYRQEVRPFTEKQIALVQNFAAQAVIAIENTRLLNELRQSLEQQTATADVLRIISTSPGELEPVFQAMLENATRICGARFGVLLLFESGRMRVVGMHNAPEAFEEMRRRDPYIPLEKSILGSVVKTKKLAHVTDITVEEPYASSPLAKIGGARTALGVPMLKENELVGAIAIYRQEVQPFADKQIELLRNFAAQAVIAIENARLLSELRQRTSDLTESLEQQTTTAEILGVISESLSDTQPVFDAIVESGARLFSGAAVSIALVENGMVKAAAVAERDPVRAELWRQRFPFPLTREYMHSVAILDRKMLDIPDVENGPAEMKVGAKNFLESGYRAATFIPLMRGETAIGALSVVRFRTGPLSEKQLAVLKTYANQAEIAIENTRLLNELRESLEQQTATSEVLSVISSSPGDLQPVFATLLANATRICEAKFGALYLPDGEAVRLAAAHDLPPRFSEAHGRGPFRPAPDALLGVVMRTKQAVHLDDVAATWAYAERYPPMVAAVELGGVRTVVAVPLLKDDELVGIIAIYRQEVRPFTDKQIALVQNFAAQAVIAIENTRLLNELRESLEQQTATSEVLRVISSSPGALEPVFQAMMANATRICEAQFGILQLQEDGRFRNVAMYNPPSALAEYRQREPVINAGPQSAIGRVAATKQLVHIVDYAADPAYIQRDPAAVNMVERAGARTVLLVPMLKDGEHIGNLNIYRQEVRPFTDKQIALVQNFSAQAVIAIENTRLLNELRQRTTDLTESLESLRTAQDRLVQTEKLASLGQLTAGIAHEIKNPLNFVNNFSSVSVELIDELRGALGGIHLDTKARTEISEIADTLQSNLDRIVQHGKRADAIVKNMLLHSRQGSGEHRLVDINALVEESLNLAYHGARAEKQGFEITLDRLFDPAAGEVDLFPQEITRVLLNLISNGFYAATKRQAESDGGSYEPILAAATKNLGHSVEIRIRDNGTGIPPDVKEKMFNPFFTTKPAGEGTGLGLSISHDIIVKQHSGSIEVDTKPGEFTEFRIVLPRKGASLGKPGDHPP